MHFIKSYRRLNSEINLRIYLRFFQWSVAVVCNTNPCAVSSTSSLCASANKQIMVKGDIPLWHVSKLQWFPYPRYNVDNSFTICSIIQKFRSRSLVVEGLNLFCRKDSFISFLCLSKSSCFIVRIWSCSFYCKLYQAQRCAVWFLLNADINC